MPSSDRGAVNVLYAASLQRIMEDQLGPGFTRSSPFRFVGFGAGSSELATEIKDRIRQADVFISAAPTANQALMGTRNGSWLTWYANFASVPLVLGYDPTSRFAAALRSQPWFTVVTEPGFLLGRTDPAVDPKGQLAVQALQEERLASGDQRIAEMLQSTSNVFPEETLVGRLESGQLDAAFLYASEAEQAQIPTVSLGSTHLGTTYTVTVLARAPNRNGAVAFVDYLLGPKGRQALARAGLSTMAPPTVTGSAVPASLHLASRHR